MENLENVDAESLRMFNEALSSETTTEGFNVTVDVAASTEYSSETVINLQGVDNQNVTIDSSIVPISTEELISSEINTEDPLEDSLNENTTSINEETPAEPVIPLNSDTLLINEATSRFSGATWYEALREKEITVAGIGGIGSYVGFLLSRMQPKRIILYDPDIVEYANMSGQLYSSEDVGESKVNALISMMKKYSAFYAITAISERFDTNSTATPIMICGFDSMIARKCAFVRWRSLVANADVEEKSKYLFIDGRLAAEEFQVFAIQGNDERAIIDYEGDWLFNDEEAEETICSYKQTTFMANMIASVMVNLFVNFVTNECSYVPRDVPFITSYSANIMYFKTKR